MAPEILKLTCPCGKNVRGVAFMEHATLVVDRHRKACKGVWRVIIRPMSRTKNGNYVHVVEWTPLPK